MDGRRKLFEATLLYADSLEWVESFYLLPHLSHFGVLIAKLVAAIVLSLCISFVSSPFLGMPNLGCCIPAACQKNRAVKSLLKLMSQAGEILSRLVG